MGGMQVLQWAARYQERVFTAVPIAAAAWHSSQNIAFHEVGRQAVMADPELARGPLPGARQGAPQRPGRGAHGRAHHLSLGGGPAAQVRPQACRIATPRASGFDADFQVESYLRHQGSTFVDRFDANSYLYITRAMDYFDLAAEHGDVLANAFKGTKTRFCVVSFTTDWLYPDAREPRDRARAECGGRQRQLRRDRVRQGPRRLPARRAGAVRHRRAASSMRRPSKRGLQAREGSR